jgi:hypothetical protein
MPDFVYSDIYREDDTMEVYDIELLRNLYMQTSKYSNYQVTTLNWLQF